MNEGLHGGLETPDGATDPVTPEDPKRDMSIGDWCLVRAAAALAPCRADW